MELEVREIFIKDVQFGDKIEIMDHILYINKDEIADLLRADERIAGVKIDLARPGESVRIIPVKDVIEPRAKLNGDAFPGIDGKIEAVGSGVTYALKGCSVITTGPIVGFQEGIIDMCGPLAEYTPFAHLNNIVIHIQKKEGLHPHEHEEAVRIAGIKAAHYIAKKVLNAEYDRANKYFWNHFGDSASDTKELPRVAYVYLCMSQGLLHDTYFYGKDTKKISPSIISPLEVFDGAIVSGNCVSPGSKTTTFHHQNNAVIRECFKRHGLEINFAGIVLNPLMVTLEDKIRNSVFTVKLVEMLGVEGVVISQEGFGNPTTDLMMICERLEKKGIKTVLISNEDAGVDGKSESLPDGTVKADAIVSTGNSNATIKIPPMDKILGDLQAIEHVTGGFVGSIQEDGGLIIEIHGIMGSHNLQGYSKLSAVTV
ncbi:glycine/sarcosine/betaine reductase component B subunit [Geosporobacter ferrireducens]|uniref:Beta-aspartyl-peptidase n=1 Tax=Geosporobacter ferrireducens TaxID=1424294 RepID=A0A1D8GE90_9FIRM|nr:glycine/sarcosine/betaine reductase component B subunit [Geosporobacter ferrireducens]AOT69200.1 beta-aspartyl-peptidase [Geosporobacter ferrireducens]MTI56878.1 beta-aspartyl-peptidase [Geosporobacter ferrireducens]